MNKLGHQRGFSLTEALVAFSIVGIGLLAVATFQSGLFKESADNKARTEALALAQQKIEQFKHYTQADESAYIDEDDDGVMDAVGYYSDDPITGQNAVFQRSWELGTNDLGSEVQVSVSWIDSDNEQQTVSLVADIPWISPRTAADQIVELADPLVDAPTGRARVGEGHLSDLPSGELITFPNIYPDDGLSMYQHKDNLLLTNNEGDILLTLVDACAVETGKCTDFVRIAGTVYLDKTNLNMNIEDIQVLASDAAFCQRWVPDGSLSKPPSTAGGDYDYYHYTCYLGGGWHGNIGFVTRSGLRLTDKVCQGDPTAFDAWERPVIALRRAYRGMIHKDVSGERYYYSQGIKDATRLIGQDYVFTAMATTVTDGERCATVNAPMTRPDSYSGKLFADVPTDFVCLNQDADGDQQPDYLDYFDPTLYAAETTCPFDPTTPPVQSHTISGAIDISTAVELDLSNFRVVTSDGPGNCTVALVAETFGRKTLGYRCTVYDWGSGWTGAVALRPNSNLIFCPDRIEMFSELGGDAKKSFGCIGGPTISIEGSITYLTKDGGITRMRIEEAATGTRGGCEFMPTQYRCVAPYDGVSWNGTLEIDSSRYVCGSTDNVLGLSGLTRDGSPYKLNLVIAQNSANCPVLPSL